MEQPEGTAGSARRPAPPSPGERLRAERERGGLTVREAAEELHLDLWMVEALEGDEFSRFGAPVFAKGHLRKYAALLGIASDDIMVSYYQAVGARTPSPAPVSASLVRRPNWGRTAALIGAAILVAVVAGAVIWWFVRPAAPEVAAPATARPEQDAALAPAMTPALQPADGSLEVTPSLGSLTRAQAPDAASQDEVGAGAEAGPGGPASPEPVQVSTDPVATAAEDPPALSALPLSQPGIAADGRATVSLRFAEESWVEVRDGEGRQLLFGLGSPGTTETVEGATPVEVFLGRARGVSVEVGGEPYDIPTDARRGNTARFSVGNPPQ